MTATKHLFELDDEAGRPYTAWDFTKKNGKNIPLPFPPHLNPYLHKHDGKKITKSAAPKVLLNYEPFEIVLRILQGTVTADEIRKMLPEESYPHARAPFALRSDWDLNTVHPSKRPGLEEHYSKFLSAMDNRKVVLAGGSIRDLYLLNPAAINDIDVWVLGCGEQSRDREWDVQDFLNCLSQTGDYVWQSHEYHLDRLSARDGVKVYNILNCKIPKVCHPIQIMFTSAKTPEELIGQFDWGICQFAYDGRDFWFPGWKDFALNELTLNEDHIHDPYYTLQRGILLADKFRKFGGKLRLKKSVAITLLGLVLMQYDGKETI